MFFMFAECRISFAKIAPTSAMKACFQIAECRISYAKLNKNFGFDFFF